MIARALHLIDPARCGWPALTLLGTLAADRASRIEHEVLIVGGATAEARAREHGVRPRGRFTMPLDQPLLGVRMLARIVASRPPPDLIVPWSIPTTRLASRAGAGLPIVPVMTLPPPQNTGVARWTSFARRLRQSALVVYPSAFLRDSWVARFTLLGCPSSVIPVSIAASPASDRRAELREQWGAEPGTIVITALGEPEEAVDAHAAVFAAGVLGVAGRAAMVVVPPRASRLDRALRFASLIRPSRRVLVDDRPMPALLEGVDLAVWSEPTGEASRPRGSVYTMPLGAISLAWAAARGIPIVAHEHPAWRSVLPEPLQAIAVADRTRRQLTHAILRALDVRSTEPVATPTLVKSWSAEFEGRILEMLRASEHKRVG